MVPLFVGTLFIAICVLLIVVVLLQKGRGGGLGAAFGGAAASAFGTRVGDVFTWVTIILTALFLLLAIGTTMVFRTPPGDVARPYFIPKPEDYTNYADPAFVKMLSATPDTDIWYTLDGSEPTKDAPNATLFKTVAKVPPGTTIKARAYREGGWTVSAVSEAYYGPPLTPPADQPLATEPGALMPALAPEMPPGLPREVESPTTSPAVPVTAPAE